jgi:hypothetical protein
MARPALEAADVFRRFGPAYRAAQAGHLSLGQLQAMSAIEMCRTAELGGHVEACTDCGVIRCSFNSCRNRHCPKCLSSSAQKWLDARQEELLPVRYFHVVFTIPEQLNGIAHQNKEAVYGLLFKATAETLQTIAADPKHLGARIGFTAVLHSWGSALTHHPHLHCVVPGGGVSPDGKRWIHCRRNYFLPVTVLSELFRRLFLAGLHALFAAGELELHGSQQRHADPKDFAELLAPLWKCDWVVYAKEPFAGPEQVLAYLSRYTHRVAIANSRLIKMTDEGVTFRWKDYRRKGADRKQIMTLAPDEFMRRFLLHILPKRFHRIRYYGLFANGQRKANLERCRELLALAVLAHKTAAINRACCGVPQPQWSPCVCPHCGGHMVVIERIEPLRLRPLAPRQNPWRQDEAAPP